MMRGPYTSAMAVRKPDGEIYLETWETNGTGWYTKVPLLRGVCNLLLSLPNEVRRDFRHGGGGTALQI